MSKQDPLDRSPQLNSRLGAATSKDEALQLLLAEAERVLARLNLTDEPTARKELRSNARSLLSRAETIKASGEWKSGLADIAIPRNDEQYRHAPVSRRVLSKAEQIITLRGSFVSGCKFPPWRQKPSQNDFKIGADGEAFTDPVDLQLSRAQLATFDAWLRPAEALARRAHDQLSPEDSPALDTIDLVQDAATDCSVVASMCALITRAERGHRRLMGDWFSPYDELTQLPTKSENGRYVAKFNFNGCFRRVEVDDRLPISTGDRVIHVIDRNHPCLIWPALIEKMYLKVRGGYDFPGSNSSTDLWVLTGWIPEQIFLESDDVFPSDIWRRIWDAHLKGDVMITLGTGRLSSRVERGTGLASEHSYAVLNLHEEQDQQLMLVKNPWTEGSTWRRNHKRKPVTQDASSDDAVQSPRDLLNEDKQLFPGSFWMDFPSVIQNFESIYLNWNPARYSKREDLHFCWVAKDIKYPGTFLSNPQFSLVAESGGLGCALLNRHFRHDRGTPQGETTTATAEIFIRLLLYEEGGKRVMLRHHPLASTPFVAAHHTLLHLPELKAGARYTLVADQDTTDQLDYDYSLCLFSDSTMILDIAPPHFTCNTTIDGSWTDRNAGGNASSPLFSQNPQYRLVVTKPCTMSIVIASMSAEVPVNVKLCFSQGKRVQSIRSRDVIADSHDYRPACAEASRVEVDAGIYTIVCSTYEPGQYADFILSVGSSHPVQLSALPNEGAGLLRSTIPNATFSHEEQAQAILLLPQRLTRLMAVAKHIPSATSGASSTPQRSMIRLSIKQGDTYDHKTLATSADDAGSGAEFRDSLIGARVADVDLSSAMSRAADLWLVLERNGAGRQGEDESFGVEFWTDSVGAVQTGDWQEWDEI